MPRAAWPITNRGSHVGAHPGPEGLDQAWPRCHASGGSGQGPRPEAPSGCQRPPGSWTGTSREARAGVQDDCEDVRSNSFPRAWARARAPSACICPVLGPASGPPVMGGQVTGKPCPPPFPVHLCVPLRSRGNPGNIHRTGVSISILLEQSHPSRSFLHSWEDTQIGHIHGGDVLEH